MIRAGAIWRSNALPDEHELQRWDYESYRTWLELISNNKEEAEKAGVLVNSK